VRPILTSALSCRLQVVLGPLPLGNVINLVLNHFQEVDTNVLDC
jgi:hypothetical protein